MTHVHGHEARLVCENITFAYPGQSRFLRDVSLTLESGERLGIVGPNGSGKTTLLLCLTGLLHAAGRRRLDDEELPPGEPDGAHVGLVFQNAEDMLFMPTVLEDVAFGPRNLGLEPEAARDRALKQLDRLGIAHLAQAHGLKLSGGQQRLAALATVLAMEPPVLLLDEPTSNLDDPGRDRLLALLRELPGSLLMASHDRDAIRAVCSRVLVMHDGIIVDEMPAARLPARPGPDGSGA